MPYFKDQDEMLAIQRLFFERVARDPVIAPQLRKSNLIIRFKALEPEAVVTINCREPSTEGDSVTLVFGPSDLAADLTIISSADFSHEFWQGKANIIGALLSGKVKAEGDFSQAAKIMPVLKPIAAIYVQNLRELGREDLILK